MVFSSITFLFYFLPVVLGLYFLAPCRAKNLVLLTVSLFFYAWGEPVYVLLMIVSILINYIIGLLLSRKKSKGILALGTALNLLILGFFKYADFLLETVNSLTGSELALLELPLPIGISFYTFQAMSYIIDLYRGEVRTQKNLIDFAAYVALFPQLIAGPIVRIRSIQDQLHFRQHNWGLFGSGVRRFVIGLGKKVLIANNMGMIWDSVSAGDMYTTPVLTAWLGIVAFSIQIYFDFSGYSDMAIGLGRMFGFEFPENFRYPYIAKSITEFWRRWHISLGTWFKEYVYIPLGGNRKGLIRQLFNILVVWMLTGLWHGAAWNFVLWGLYFALLLLVEKTFLIKVLEKTPAAVQHIYVVFLIVISWLIFSIDSIQGIVEYLGAMFGLFGNGLADGTSIYIFTNNIVLFIIAVVGCTQLPARAAGRLMNRLESKIVVSTVVETVWIVLMLLACTAYITASTYNPFLYFRF